MAANRREGLYRKDAGTVDSEGFIAPSVGLVEHALYFTTAPDVLVKTRQVIDQNRLEYPGAVVVWDETIGRRTGRKAVPGSWWAGPGSITMAFVFERPTGAEQGAMRAVAEATLDAIAAFSPTSPATYDGAGQFWLAGKRLGMLRHEVHGSVDVYVLRLNGSTDFSKAPKAVQEANSRLIDHIDARNLPLGDPGTLANTLSVELMKKVPNHLGRAA